MQHTSILKGVQTDRSAVHHNESAGHGLYLEKLLWRQVTVNIKRLGTFVAAYFVITMAWAYPWHMVFFHDLYVQMGAFQRAAPIMPLGISAILIQGIVIGYLYPFFYKGQSSVRQGIVFNLIIGLMTYTAMGFATAAKFQIEPVSTFLLYHTVFQLIQFTLTGAALGFIFKENKKDRKEGSF